ncbi:hypothetical protein V6Z11_A03G134900 [Gossypium hirsutum]
MKIPKCRVWYHFLKTCLLHSTHNSIVSKVRILVLYSIMQARKFNVGKIIINEVHQCTQNNTRSLNFPSLITLLCQDVNVSIQENKNVIPNNGDIIRLIVTNISREELTQQQSLAQPQQPLCQHLPLQHFPLEKLQK